MMIPLRLALEPRLSTPRFITRFSPILAIISALGIGALILFGAGVNPLKAYHAIFRAAFFGGWYALSDTAVKATPLLLTGIACALTFKARLWNIGAEGQLCMGAWAATGIASFWLPGEVSSFTRISLMAIAAMLLGGFWALWPGLLKAKFGVNEIITSLMLVYVAQHWNNYWIYGPWSDRGFQLTPMFPRAAWLPRLSDLADRYEAFTGITVHLGLGFGLVAALILWFILHKTSWGFQLRVIGDSPAAARYAGISVAKQTILVMMVSGCLAGLAGMAEVAGVVHRLQERFSPGYGFTAIIVAFLAKLNPLAIILVSILFGGLLVGAKEVQPAGIPLMLQGVILFVVIGWEVFVTNKVVIRVEQPHHEAEPEHERV